MLDFVNVFHENTSRKTYISASFTQNTRIKDLMTIGKESGTFYAVWDFENNCWTKSKDRLYELIDICINEYVEKLKNTGGQSSLNGVKILLATNSESGISKNFAVYTKGRSQSFKPLDTKVVFKSDPPSRELYSSHRLPYDPIEMDTPCYDKLMSVLYKPEEQQKIEWLIGAGLCRDNDKIQKFGVLYGEPGTGKGTVLDIIKMLFDGYTASFEADALASKNDQFALEPFKNHPVVAIQTDGNLSRIEDNARLNTLIAHETLTVNEKFKGKYDTHFDSILFIGTNEPVKITNAKSGLLRRLIDIEPTGNTIPKDEYDEIKNKIPFELPGIAFRCMELYRNNKKLYNAYRPMLMMARTNEFYDFVLEYYDRFNSEDYILLSVAWEWYKKYVEDAHSYSKMPRRAFASELSTYFEYGPQDEWSIDENGNRKHMSSVYRNFKKDKFKNVRNSDVKVVEIKKTKDQKKEVEDELDFLPEWLKLSDITKRSISEIESNPLNLYLRDGYAQYADTTESGNSKPKKAWDNIKSKLTAIDSTREHYILTQSVDPKLIVIDFDLKDPESGKKSLKRNLIAAKLFPVTYAETSKSGNGLHLHYIYDGDPEELSMVFDKEIEIKVFRGKSALRRKLYLCNNEPIAHISSGLPLKEVNKKMINWEGVQNEKHLRALIEKGLKRKVFANTKPSIDYIAHVIEEAYEGGLSYNVIDLQPRVINMAYSSTNNKDYCVSKVLEMEFRSEDNKERDELGETRSNSKNYDDLPITFYDVEVFPNLFILCYKEEDNLTGEEAKKKVVKVINPTSNFISEFVRTHKLVGFNNLNYDNHIMYARILGYSNYELYELSKSLIAKKKDECEKKNYGFVEAKNLSYTDIYDFSNTKQGLKKWEIELGIHHQEFGYSWDEEVPDNVWEEAADYCANDVVATEAVFNHGPIKQDWHARQILSKLSGLSVNDKTNAHTCRIIFGKNKSPQSDFVYPDLSKEFPGYEYSPMGFDKELYNIGCDGKSVRTTGKSIYMGDDPSEGGYVYFETGIHRNVALLDIASLHPTTIEVLQLFGPTYTERFSEIKKTRIAIKHKQWDEARGYLDGELVPFLEGIENKSKDEQQELSDFLSYAFKICLNSVYGLTSASFPNPCRDPRNVDNVVAKRGALFMILLKHTIQKMGYTVVHVKTDSIKIANADDKIILFVMEFGKKYGYTFEHEATYERMCLANKSSYVARYDEFGERTKGGKHANQWTVTGDTFMHPYLFKTLFSHEDIVKEDYCETKSVSGNASIYIDKNEDMVYGLTKELYSLKEELLNATSGKMEIRKKIKEKQEEIDLKHNMVFVGRCGLFAPVVDGVGGGYLLRVDGDKVGAVSGTKGYRWLECEEVINSNKWDKIDIGYFRKLVDDAYDEIAQYGDVNEFINV